ncbi:hypothetical protein MLD38_029197 [Melastoma candidum]|uniref:Uncharacterized protein n=1 Tax=Melastoma candidum TaxID=119954 RepID=A0ACB9N7G0_9MYRT|nr:hypothetical protein MLD38_029197 [Melastoma candidum]
MQKESDGGQREVGMGYSLSNLGPQSLQISGETRVALLTRGGCPIEGRFLDAMTTLWVTVVRRSPLTVALFSRELWSGKHLGPSVEPLVGEGGTVV